MKLLAGNTEDERTNPFPWPLETWELQELVLAGCPAEAVKVFRKSLIGRGNPLTANQADSSLSEAHSVIRTGPLNPNDKRAKRPEVPETTEAKLPRLRWYLRLGMPVAFARPPDYKWTGDELAIISDAREAGCPLTFLEWYEREPEGDETGPQHGVDRVAGPAPVEATG